MALIGVRFVHLADHGCLPVKTARAGQRRRAGPIYLSRDKGLAAWVRPGCWQDRGADLRRSCHLPFGTFTAEQAAGINLFDLLAHGWDISQATGASLVCPDTAWETGLKGSSACHR